MSPTTNISLPHNNLEIIISFLRSQFNPRNVEGMTRFGINPEFALGISMKTLRNYAKTIKKNHQLALDLWNSNFHEAKILATIVDKINSVTEKQMDNWVLDFNSWDLCDQCCNNLFGKTVYSYKKAIEWSSRTETFVKRAGFTLMAVSAVHRKDYSNEQFDVFFERIIAESNDDRNFVKKAVNWALRQIGKKNDELNFRAITIAEELRNFDSKSARWIGNDAFTELTSEKVQARIQKKNNLI